MAKSSRASRIKKNNQALKKKVFGPVELARNERLSAKLLEIASQPKPLRSEMELEVVQDDEADATKAESKSSEKANEDAEVEEDGDEADEDVEMDTKSTTRKAKSDEPRSANSIRRRKEADKARVDKKRHRRERNKLVFKTGRGKRGSSSKGDGPGKVRVKGRR